GGGRRACRAARPTVGIAVSEPAAAAIRRGDGGDTVGAGTAGHLDRRAGSTARGTGETAVAGTTGSTHGLDAAGEEQALADATRVGECRARAGRPPGPGEPGGARPAAAAGRGLRQAEVATLCRAGHRIAERAGGTISAVGAGHAASPVAAGLRHAGF